MISPDKSHLAIEGPGVLHGTFELTDDPITLGRVEDNPITLPDAAVSRRHAQVYRQDGQTFIMDLGSMNGTVVNGLRIAVRQPFQLRTGDRIQVGPFTLTFVTESGRAGDAPAYSSGPAHAHHAQPTTPHPSLDAEQIPCTLVAPEYLPGRAPIGPAAGHGSTTVFFAGGAPPRMMVWTGSVSREVTLKLGTTTIGRAPENDIVIDDTTVSRRHAEIRVGSAGLEIVDLGSGNGIYLHGQRINQRVMVDNDAYKIGEHVQLVYRAPATDAPETPKHSTQQIDLGDRASLTIGRDPSNDFDLPHPAVSRFHARLERRGGGFVIVDLGSTNGTYVNGARVAEAAINETDHIKIGPFDFTMSGSKLERSASDGNIRVDALALSRVVGKGITILNSVYLTIKPREFVAVVGASGSGKSTLIDALCGFRPATAGKVLYNGTDLYHSFDSFRTSIGYVPQDDIIHRDLTVYRALNYAAQLRLPKDTNGQERHARIAEVLDELGLTERRDTPIHRLSGGQRKRVSIGVELLTKPSLFFLDEPTSGLDPATETRMMRLMRELADQGRTLILITHATQNILLCDKVVFMSKGGQVAFFGTPNEALDFFGVQEFVDIYELLDKEQEIGTYAGKYRNSPYHHIHLGEVAGQSGQAAANLQRTGAAPKAPNTGISRLQQFFVLTARYLDITLSNRKALSILLLQAPIVALLLGVVFPRAAFSDIPLLIPRDQAIAAGIRPTPDNPLAADTVKACGLTDQQVSDLPSSLRSANLQQPCGDARKGMLMLFLVSIVSIWFGTSNAAKEIVKELPIYRRERAVSLKIMPYLASKMTVLFGISAVQTVMLLSIVMLLIVVPVNNLLVPAGIFLTTFLTFVTATLFGLLISSVVGSPDESGNIVPILLIPQIIFAGAMLALGEMGVIAKGIAQIVISKWSWEALGGIVDLERIIRAQGGPQLSLLDENKWKGTFDAHFLPVQWGVLALFCLIYLSISYLALKRKDSL